MLNTVLSSRVSRVGRVSAMVSVRFSGMFNMVQEFGTVIYRIADASTAVSASTHGRYSHTGQLTSNLRDHFTSAVVPVPL